MFLFIYLNLPMKFYYFNSLSHPLSAHLFLSLPVSSRHILSLPVCSRYGHHVSRTSYVLCDDPPTIQRIFSRLRSFGSSDGSYPQHCGGVPVLQVRDVTTGYDSSQPDCRSVSSLPPLQDGGSVVAPAPTLLPSLFSFFLPLLLPLVLFLRLPLLPFFLLLPLLLQVLPVTRNSHMITFSLQNGVVATLRTSGTEPKIKLYGEYCAAPGVR